jgi:hypothetical protein
MKYLKVKKRQKLVDKKNKLSEISFPNHQFVKIISTPKDS